MKNICIGFDGKKFIITCPIHMNGVVKNIPQRRFNPRKKRWEADLIKMNVLFFEKYPDIITFTENAQKAINQFKSQLNNLNTGQIWDDDYKFKTKPRFYQKDVIESVFPLSVFALFIDMRLGKSKILIDVLTAHKINKLIKSVIIICPRSIRHTWRDELKDHCPIDHQTNLLDSRDKKFYNWIEKEHSFPWLIVGVESLSAGKAKDMMADFAEYWDQYAVVVDESSKIKNHRAKRSEQCKKVGNSAKIKSILTGTPITHGPPDFYSQFEFLDPNIIGIGDYYSFKNRYCLFGGFENKQIIGYKNLEELSSLIDPYTVQIRKKDVTEIIEPERMVRKIQMNPEQKKLYNIIRKIKDGKYKYNDQEHRIENILEKTLRLHQVCGGFQTIKKENPDPWSRKKFISEVESIKGVNPKITELMSLVEEIEGSIIIWCAYKPEIRVTADSLISEYGEDSVVEFHGDIDEYERNINKTRFQDGKSRFMVGNVSTGSMGLRLDKADTMVFLSNTRSYENRIQVEERIYDYDKSKPLLYIDIVIEKSIDELFLESFKNKKDVDDYVRYLIDHSESVTGI